MDTYIANRYGDYIGFLRRELDIQHVYIDIHQCEEWMDNDDAIAYMTDYDDYYEIEFKMGEPFFMERFMKMLAHEFTHIAQIERGMVFDFSVPYSEQEHEIEAYAKQEELYNTYKGRCAA